MLYCSSRSSCTPYPRPSCCSQPYLARPSRCCASCLHRTHGAGLEWPDGGASTGGGGGTQPSASQTSRAGRGSGPPWAGGGGAHLMLSSGSARCGSIHIRPTSREEGCRVRMPAATASQLVASMWWKARPRQPMNAPASHQSSSPAGRCPKAADQHVNQQTGAAASAALPGRGAAPPVGLGLQAPGGSCGGYVRDQRCTTACPAAAMLLTGSPERHCH
jgi:hypothetical protein